MLKLTYKQNRKIYLKKERDWVIKLFIGILPKEEATLLRRCRFSWLKQGYIFHLSIFLVSPSQSARLYLQFENHLTMVRSLKVLYNQLNNVLWLVFCFRKVKTHLRFTLLWQSSTENKCRMNRNKMFESW